MPMQANVITCIKELAKSIVYDGSDLGQENEEHDPEVAGVIPTDVDDEA